MKEITIAAIHENLDSVISFINGELEKLNCPMKTQMKIDLSAEEVFVNIADYAYGSGSGNVTIRFDHCTSENKVCLCFIDKGYEFNPLLSEEPDVTHSIDQRRIGGLGILLVKRSMDKVSYERQDRTNRLLMEKCL